MIKCPLAVVADTVIIDERTNRVSAINFLEEIRAAVFPLLIPSATAFFYLERESAEEAAVESSVIISLDGTELGRQPITLQFGNALRHRTTVLLQGLVLPRPGTVRIGIAIAETLLGSWAVTVSGPEQPSIVAETNQG